MAKIGDLLAAGRTLSFEFGPPRNEEGERRLEKTLLELEPLRPDFVSVTYGAGGSTRDGTVEITKALKDDLGFETMAHLSCVGETREGLATTLDRIADTGVENVFALRGDPPRGEEDFVQPEGGLGSAAELTEFIKLARGQESTSPTFADGRAALVLADAAARSAVERVSVSVEL